MTKTNTTTNSNGRKPIVLEEVSLVGAPFALLKGTAATVKVVVEQGLPIVEDLLHTARMGSICLRETSKA